MKIAILANEDLKAELLSNSKANDDIFWITSISQLHQSGHIDVVIDLLFDNDHIPSLKNLLPELVIINSVVQTLSETDSSFVRINGWPTFLRSNSIEASASNEQQKKKAEKAFALFNKTLEWLPDAPGFITPRVISMIINEAFISLSEGVSTKEEIDTAMKLGTNYPYGPFEWSEKIGVQKIQDLLEKLKHVKSRYTSFI